MGNTQTTQDIISKIHSKWEFKRIDENDRHIFIPNNIQPLLTSSDGKCVTITPQMKKCQADVASLALHTKAELLPATNHLVFPTSEGKIYALPVIVLHKKQIQSVWIDTHNEF